MPNAGHLRQRDHTNSSPPLQLRKCMTNCKPELQKLRKGLLLLVVGFSKRRENPTFYI